MPDQGTVISKTIKVDTKHKMFSKMADRWQRCRDVIEGGDAVHTAGERYLPKLKEMSADDYKIYNLRTTFFNATARTTSGYVGMIFRRDPVFTLPDGMKEIEQDMDGAGTPLPMLTKQVTEEVVDVSRVGVLVDFPRAEPNATQADAQRYNLRPMAQIYKAEKVINWRVSVLENKKVPVFVVLEECATERSKDNEFEDVEEPRWRVLDLVPGAGGLVYRQRLYRLADTSQKLSIPEFIQIGSDIFPTMAGKPMPFIPFLCINAQSVELDDVEAPALIDLVDVNLSHYRTTAVYEQCIQFCPPTMLLTGFQPETEGEKIYVGSRTAIVTSRADCKGQFLEYSGQGLSPLVAALDRKEAQMAVLGARLLEPQKKAVEAAEAAAIHRKGEESALATTATTVGLGMTQVLKWMTMWAGMNDTEVKAELNKDFFPMAMTPQMLTALVTSWQQGAISDQTLFSNLQAGDVIAQDATLEEEQAAILSSPMMNQGGGIGGPGQDQGGGNQGQGGATAGPAGGTQGAGA